MIVGSCKSSRLAMGKMAKRWINNNIVRRSCCVHHVSTGVEHNSCEDQKRKSVERTAVTTHGHHTCTYKHTYTIDNRICSNFEN